MARLSRKRSAYIEVLESRRLLSTVIAASAPSVQPNLTIGSGTRQMEYLDRGLIALRTSSTGAYIGWRLLGTDLSTTSFNLYRSTNSGAPVKLNVLPISTKTNWQDNSSDSASTNVYTVKAVTTVDGEEPLGQSITLVPGSATDHLSVPLQPPPGGVTPDGEAYTYRANDTSVGDLDGDGKYELIVKWDPTNAHDSSQAGFTGNTFFDAYKLDGTRLWRIDLGRNIRAGAHYTQFIVYDLDGDGRAEVAMKTAPGTRDGLGNWVSMAGDNPLADYRNVDGRTNLGPEYLTIFDGLTGASLITTAFKADRVNTSTWGDDYGNRQDRILMAVAYLDGQKPSLVVGRGLFPGQNSSHAVRNEITAWNWRPNAGGADTLSMLWWFKADKNASSFGIPDVNTGYIGQGNYEMQVADVDGDGRDEIIYGSMTVDDNGAPKYSTGLGHGDALHVSDMDPNHPGEEIYMPMESPGSNGHITANVHDANTGAVLWSTLTTPPGSADPDVGRGVAADIDPTVLGYEVWDSYNPGIYNVAGGGAATHATKPSSFPQNFLIWWDADPLRELEDGSNNDSNTGGAPHIDKYQWTTNTKTTLLTASGAYSNNNTKATPMLVADILGDWREELLVRSTDNTQMFIYSTTIQASNRIYTLMHDTQYREAIAWQNVGYNQPPHPSFFLGAASSANNFPTIPAANIYMVQNDGLPLPPPANVATSVGGLNQINITWDAVPGATSYKVRRSTGLTGQFSLIASNVTGTSYTDNTVNNGTTYYYVVSAVNASSSSINSTQVPGRVPVPGNGSTVYPAEEAVFGLDAFFENSNGGFLGQGYVNFPSSTVVGYLQFNNVYGGVGGTSNIIFRYAFNGSTSGALIVNGVSQSITFNSTGSNTTWSTLTLPVTLNAGTGNTIRLQVQGVAGADLANVDQLTVNFNGESTPPTSTFSYAYLTSPNTVTFFFSEAVDPSLSASDLVVTLLGPDTTIVPTAYAYNPLGHVATWTLPVGLGDGNYRATFISGGVIDSWGNALSSTYYEDFFVFAGDTDHDRDVDTDDIYTFTSNFLGTGKTYAQGDFDGDGDVDSGDLSRLAVNWLHHLDPASPPVFAPPLLAVAPTSISTPPTAYRSLRPRFAARPTRTIGLLEQPQSFRVI